MELMPQCITLFFHARNQLVYSILFLSQNNNSISLQEDNDQAFFITR